MANVAITIGSLLGNLLDFWIVLPLALGLWLRRWRQGWLLALLGAALIAGIVTGLKAELGFAPAHLLWDPPMILGAFLANALVATLAALLRLRATQ
jgi:peptidoglycan/LPS O-acetylase OafA/YrhL